MSKVGVNRTQIGVSPKADSGVALRIGSRAVPGLGQELLNRMELSDRSPGCVPTPGRPRNDSHLTNFLNTPPTASKWPSLRAIHRARRRANGWQRDGVGVP